MAFKIARVHTADRLINQLQQNIAGPIEPLFNNLSGSFVTTLSGCTTSPTGLMYWQRATSEGPVTLFTPQIFGTSNSDTSLLSGLPSALWPITEQVGVIRIEDNTAWAFGILVVKVTGVIQLYPLPAGGSWTTSGTKGIGSTCVTYITAI